MSELNYKKTYNYPNIIIECDAWNVPDKVEAGGILANDPTPIIFKWIGSFGIVPGNVHKNNRIYVIDINQNAFGHFPFHYHAVDMKEKIPALIRVESKDMIVDIGYPIRQLEFSSRFESLFQYITGYLPGMLERHPL